MISLVVIIFATTSISVNIYAQENGKFKDNRDDKIYKTIKIGNQVWMAENLAFEKNIKLWDYKDVTDYVTKYGHLYGYGTAQKVCPVGWHLPSKNDFEKLLNNYGGEGKKSYKALKKDGKSGFSALWGLQGYLSGDALPMSAIDGAAFWSSNEYGTFLVISQYSKSAFLVNPRYGNPGLFVRCVKD